MKFRYIIIPTLTVSLVPFSTVLADNPNYIYTSHNTYINKANNIEYYVENSLPVDNGHMLCCEDYLNYIGALYTVDVPSEDELIDLEIEDSEELKDEASLDDSNLSVDLNSEEELEVVKIDSEEKVDSKKVEAILSKEDSKYVANTWYHPSDINPQGYVGEIEKAIMKDNFVTSNWNVFKVEGNPFALGQCTYFAWSRFYQVYGFDSGARGNGKTNAAEIVKANKDTFVLSSTPAAGSVYSIEKNSLYPEYGHVGFIEAYDGEYVWISEGNVLIGDKEGNIWLHKVKWQSFKAMFPDVTFAVPKEGSSLVKKATKVDAKKNMIKLKKIKFDASRSLNKLGIER